MKGVAEYAVLLAVTLVIIIAVIELIGSGASNVFSAVASSISRRTANPEAGGPFFNFIVSAILDQRRHTGSSDGTCRLLFPLVS
jgi:Flp pilus assembly pilin Flp